MTVYEVLEEYIYSKKHDIDDGKVIVVEVRDTDTFERLVVKARVYPPGSGNEGGDKLVLRNLAENVAEEGWAIEIVEELDGDSVESRPESAFRKGAGSGA